MKSVMWASLVAVLTALSTAVAFRLADRLWRRVAHEPPPEVKGSVGMLSRFLVQKPASKGAASALARFGL